MVTRNLDPSDTQTVAVGGVRSGLHALHVAAWLRSHTASGTRLVIADADPRCETVLAEYLDVSYPVVQGRPTVYLCIGAPSPRILIGLARQGFRGPVVRLDEGLGSYADWRGRFDALAREGASRLRGIGRTAAGAVSSQLGTRWPSFLQSESGWSPNAYVGAEFERRVPSEVDDDPNRVVYLMQPWVSLGVRSLGEQRAVLAELSDRFAAQGRQLVARPHPLDESAVADQVPTIGGTGLAETEARVLGAGLVIGETTTSLINLGAFLRRPVAVLTVGSTPRLSPRQADLLRYFIPDSIIAG